MSKSKQRGTRAETAIVDYLRHWFPLVERRALSGNRDKGDVAGLPGVVIEAKDCVTVTLADWLKEAEAEAKNAHAPIWAVWWKRRGKSSPADWYVTMPGSVFVELLREHTEGERYAA